MWPSQSKPAFFKAIEHDFMSEHAIGYPVGAKPDLRDPLSIRLKMTIPKWEYALQPGARSHAAARRPMGLSEGLAMHKDLYRSTSK